MSDETLPVPIDPNDGLLVPGLATDHPAAQRMMKALARKTPKALVKVRPGPRGMSFKYVHWSWIVQRLNKVFGATWGREVSDVDRLDLPDLPPRHDRECGGKRGKCKADHQPRKRVEVIAHVRITTPWGNKDAVGGHTYFPDNAEQGYADAEQAAISKGMKRAAALLGVGLDLYTDLPDEGAVQDDFEEQDAKAAWREALRGHKLGERIAIGMLSKALADGDSAALPMLDDCLAATGEDGAGAYRKLVEVLGEAVKGAE